MFPAITASEEKVAGLLRQLPPGAVQQVQDFVVFLAARHCDWDYGDAGSLARAVNLMASDPFLAREICAVNEDFADAEADGLESYR
jgi:hypothetical protein